MKTKRIELKIQTQEEFHNEMRKYMKLIDKGVRKKLCNESLSVGSISELQKLLTPKRIELLAVIREKKPGSIYELAKLVKRKQGNVQKDVNFLANLGLIDLEKKKRGRKKTVPKVDYDSIDFRVPLVAAVCFK